MISLDLTAVASPRDGISSPAPGHDATAVLARETRYGQCWYRGQAVGPGASNLSEASAIRFLQTPTSTRGAAGRLPAGPRCPLAAREGGPGLLAWCPGLRRARMAEAEGFEPPVGCPTSVFKTGAFSQALPRLRTAGAAGAV